MKNIQILFIAFFLAAFLFPNQATSQNDLASEPSYEVNKVYPYISIEEDKLKEAKTLADLNYKYKAAWISEYISVEIMTTQNGQVKKALGKNDTLTEEQKANLLQADPSQDISVLVKYIPQNDLKNKESKEMDFTFSIEPSMDAKYSDSQQSLNLYLQEKMSDKISDGIFQGYDLAAVKFTVSEEGEIVDAHIFESSKDEKTDELLLTTINDLTDWKPAKYSNGTNAKQEFVFTVGNMKSCVVNLLSIKKYKLQ